MNFSVFCLLLFLWGSASETSGLVFLGVNFWDLWSCCFVGGFSLGFVAGFGFGFVGGFSSGFVAGFGFGLATNISNFGCFMLKNFSMKSKELVWFISHNCWNECLGQLLLIKTPITILWKLVWTLLLYEFVKEKKSKVKQKVR